MSAGCQTYCCKSVKIRKKYYFGYCYATTTSAARTGACNDQVQVQLKLE